MTSLNPLNTYMVLLLSLTRIVVALLILVVDHAMSFDSERAEDNAKLPSEDL